MAVCEVISRFLHIHVNRLINIRKYKFPHLVDKQRKSIFYLGVGERSWGKKFLLDKIDWF
ncbi:MAG: hypothetical protein KAS13_05585, partial [Candidatus Omnitrophica bacterium]|nr:hypothetical protein [Candidatus Omnitrophota bacterium]